MEFHDWLQETIRDSGMVRKEIAKLAGIPKNHLDAWCTGASFPSNYEISRLSKALNIDEMEIDDAINGKHEPKLEPIAQHPGFVPSDPTAAGGTPFKPNNETPLKPINGRTCILTGLPNPENAHYTGYLQDLFGKGMSEKCDNLFVAEINKKKHQEFDQPKERKDLQASHDFMAAILLTIKRKVELGLIEIKG